jgi:hypothetical protein
LVQITFSKDKLDLLQILAPIEVKILLCRCSAQKIATDSGKKLLKNNIKPKNPVISIKYNQELLQGDRHSQNPIKDPKHAVKNTQPPMTRRTLIRNPKAAQIHNLQGHRKGPYR